MKRRQRSPCSYKTDIDECWDDRNCFYDYDKKECVTRIRAPTQYYHPDLIQQRPDLSKKLPLDVQDHIYSFLKSDRLIDNYPDNPRRILQLLETASDDEIIDFLTFLPDNVNDGDFLFEIVNKLKTDKVSMYIGASGNIDLLLLYDLNPTHLDEIIMSASMMGHTKMVEAAHKMLDEFMSDIVSRGIGPSLLELVTLMANTINSAMIVAASNGHFDIVELMTSVGAFDFDSGLEAAAIGGNIDIIDFMLMFGATSYNTTMATAAYNGHIDIVRMMIELGATDFDTAIANAVEAGHLDIRDFLETMFN